MSEMLQKDLLPAVFSYEQDLALTGCRKKELLPGIRTLAEETQLKALSALADGICEQRKRLESSIKTAESMQDHLQAGIYYHDTILPQMEALRLLADEAERLIPDEKLPYPTYDSLLFYA